MDKQAQMVGLRRSASYRSLDPASQRVMEVHLVQALGADAATAARRTRRIVGRDLWRQYRNRLSRGRRLALTKIANAPTR